MGIELPPSEEVARAGAWLAFVAWSARGLIVLHQPANSVAVASAGGLSTRLRWIHAYLALIQYLALSTFALIAPVVPALIILAQLMVMAEIANALLARIARESRLSGYMLSALFAVWISAMLTLAGVG